MTYSAILLVLSLLAVSFGAMALVIDALGAREPFFTPSLICIAVGILGILVIL